MEAAGAISQIAEAQPSYRSPYASDPAPVDSLAQSTLKRRFSTAEPVSDEEQKRQRYEASTEAGIADALGNDDELARMIAQATASVTQQIEQSATDDAANAIGNNVQHEPTPAPEVPMQTVEANPQTPPEQKQPTSTDPHLYMRIMSLPILESLSTQIISTLTRGSYLDTINIITQPESERGQAYATLKSLFDQTKKIYSQSKPFLSAYDLGIRESEHQNIIRLTNVATFVSSVFGGQDVGFYELNDHFIKTFVQMGGELNRDLGMLYINLKTQMYLSAIAQEEPEKTKDETLMYLFPNDIERVLISRHPGSALTQSEVFYINEAQARRQYLQTQPEDADSITALSEKFSWEEFLKALGLYLKHTFEPIVAPYMQRHGLYTEAQPISPITTSNAQPNGLSNGLDDLVERAARAAQNALQGYGISGANQPTQDHSPQYTSQGPAQQSAATQQYSPSQVPFPTQTAPTQVLYEQARQAAVAKSTSHNRRPGLPSQRRPWTQEEENALMAGLDQVKGPHWSQILALYGPNGQVNEILKDRNQVQLKDKARNLKLFFLKSNIEVPYYLQCVTGELKTRAPSQAARKEAEERARLASEDEQARFNSIMTLASGMQGPSQPNGDSARHSQTPESQHPLEESYPVHQSLEPTPATDPPLPPAPLSYEESLGKQLMEDIQKHDSAAAIKAEPAT